MDLSASSPAISSLVSDVDTPQSALRLLLLLNLKFQETGLLGAGDLTNAIAATASHTFQSLAGDPLISRATYNKAEHATGGPVTNHHMPSGRGRQGGYSGRGQSGRGKRRGGIGDAHPLDKLKTATTGGFANFTLQPKKHLKHLGRLPRRLTFAQKEEFSRMIMGVLIKIVRAGHLTIVRCQKNEHIEVVLAVAEILRQRSKTLCLNYNVEVGSVNAGVDYESGSAKGIEYYHSLVCKEEAWVNAPAWIMVCSASDDDILLSAKSNDVTRYQTFSVAPLSPEARAGRRNRINYVDIGLGTTAHIPQTPPIPDVAVLMLHTDPAELTEAYAVLGVESVEGPA